LERKTDIGKEEGMAQTISSGKETIINGFHRRQVSGICFPLHCHLDFFGDLRTAVKKATPLVQRSCFFEK
jgi:hypothetical protein